MATLKTAVTARDVMTPEPACVDPATTLRELARLFDEHEISGAPVVDQEGKVIGIVSKTDVIQRCVQGTLDVPPAFLFEVLAEQGADEGTAEGVAEGLPCVQDFMTEDPLTVAAEESAISVARAMSEHRVHRVVVVDEEGFPIGIITSLDLLGALAR